MIVNVCFVKRKPLFWWDWFLGKYKHCFLAVMDTKLMIYDYRITGLHIAEAIDDDFIDVDVVQVEVESMSGGGYRPLLTCVGFCANCLKVNGVVITPNRLKKKIGG